MENNDNNVVKKILIVLLVVVFFLLISFYFFKKNTVNNISFNNYTSEIEKQKESSFNNNYYASTFQNDPTGLQKSFLFDLKNGNNDMYTKADAYFIMHRFFDNGGNIYEIYDYVNAHPELVFLKEAENLHRTSFRLIKEKSPLVVPFSDYSFLAFLAYLEILIKHGFTDVAAPATAANEYAKFAYFAMEKSKKVPKKEADEYLKYSRFYVGKTVDFIMIAYPDINKIVNKEITSKDLTPRDIVVGVNQVAASLRYLDEFGFDISSSRVKNHLSAKGINYTYIKSFREESKRLFNFSTEYAHRNVPELILFTSLLDASTLAISTSSTQKEVRNALYPILDFDTKKKENAKFAKIGILPKIIDSRFQKNSENTVNTPSDIYSKWNIVMLTSKVPEFKKWLIYNGWTESDFK